MQFGINIDHVSTVNNSKECVKTNITEILSNLKKTGIDSVTLNLREELPLSDNLIEKFSAIDDLKFNFEIPITKEMQNVVLRYKPHACCIIPEKFQTDSEKAGLNVAGQMPKIISFIGPLFLKGIDVCLFINPELEQVEASANCGARFIELNTKPYSNSFGTENEEFEFQKLKNAAEYAEKLHLTVKAGYGLNFDNIKRIKDIPSLYELNIGHDNVYPVSLAGLEKMILDMKVLLN